MTPTEIRAIACNFAEGTNIAREGARAYLLWRTGGDNRRCEVLVRARDGRWVKKWEAIYRLDKFRLVRIPEAAPEYEQLYELNERGLFQEEDLPRMLADIEGCKLGALADRATLNRCGCGSPAYECATCGERRCMKCDALSTSDQVKMAVRWCPVHREAGAAGRGVRS